MSSGEFKTGLPPIPNGIGAIAGPPYLGILLNWWLFGILTLQWYLYYVNFPNDRKLLKYTAHFICFLEMVQTFLTVADGFHWFVFGFGDMDKLAEFFLANFDTPMMSVVIAFIVQCMYAWRVYVLSKLRVITGVIVFCALAQAAGGLGIGIVNQQVGTITKWQPRFTVFSIIWVTFSAVADILIAASMTWLLLKSGNWKNGIERNSVVTKIVRLTIETNVASATVAIVTLLVTAIPSLGPPHGAFFLAPSYVLGKLYSNSFLAMLNNRAILKQEKLRNQSGGSSGGRQQWGSAHSGQPMAIQTSTYVVDDTGSGAFTLSKMKSTESTQI
ncbi:hypothetical protein D9756_000146 [Leucocoprinus leucothites]|uniref:DUF6534 domain-containing protein n=1 Tax=Leucocoprinus leucothites TaxID=201217 RepID=A0A8H5GG34_9AGAR|nr:hypothetical protein D9756_000146 [Leucoagaricus leucothites]